MIRNQRFFTQLDGLRCFAVLLTMIAHWFPEVGWQAIPYAWNGVDIFFVLSGFLITLLLLRQKEAGKKAPLLIIKNFMLRRVLRLFPLYYLFIGFFASCFFFFHILWWRPAMTWYLLTYTSNIYYQVGGAPNGIFEHTWSLAVEEQFYLLWPWLIVFLSPKKIGVAIVAVIVLALVAHAFPVISNRILFPPVKNFNTLGAGALLAYLGFYKYDQLLFQKIIQYRRWLFLIFFLMYLGVILFLDHASCFNVLRETILTLAGFFIVLNAASGWGGIGGRIMESRPVAYFGKISYGIYLLHFPVPAVYFLVAQKLFPAFEPLPALKLLIYFLITIGLASLSYRFIESPFLKLKKNFA